MAKNGKVNGKGHGKAKGFELPPGGLLLREVGEFDVNEPMTEDEKRIASGNAVEAHRSLLVAEDAARVAKEALKHAKEIEQSRRDVWNKLALEAAEGVRKRTAKCHVVLCADGYVRTYRADTGEVVDEREPTRDEKQGAMFDEDGYAPPSRPALPPPRPQVRDDLDASGPEAA